MSAESMMAEIRRRSAWGIVLGVATAAAGGFLIVHPFATGTAATVVLGWFLAVAGAAETILAFVSQTPGVFFLRLLVGVLYLLTGVVLLAFPFAGTQSLTLFLGVMLVARGVMAGIAAYQVRGIPGWGWLVADMVASVVAGLCVLTQWPSSSEWALGTMIGAAVLMTGVARTLVAAMVHSTTRTATQALGRS